MRYFGVSLLFSVRFVNLFIRLLQTAGFPGFMRVSGTSDFIYVSITIHIFRHYCRKSVENLSKANQPAAVLTMLNLDRL